MTGSILWGVYHYRLHNLPLFVPPAHGLVYLAGLSLATALAHARALVCAAAAIASGWALARAHGAAARDVAGAVGVPLLLRLPLAVASRGIYAASSSSSPPRAVRDGDRHVALGGELPGLGIPDGNPPSGVASGYVWFDVMALLVAPWLVSAARRLRRVEPKEALRFLGASGRA